MTKEGYIENIQKKLANGIHLDGEEIRTVIAALRESKHCYQEPYYEVVYHDQYGNQDHRIMNPEHRGCMKEQFSDDLYIIEDRFSVDFRRYVHEGGFVMAIDIIKNTLIDPIHKTCEECGSEFTFNYDGIKRGTHMSIWSEVAYRYVVCPVCKHECSFKVVKVEDNQPWETEQCDLSKKEEK